MNWIATLNLVCRRGIQIRHFYYLRLGENLIKDNKSVQQSKVDTLRSSTYAYTDIDRQRTHKTWQRWTRNVYLQEPFVGYLSMYQGQITNSWWAIKPRFKSWNLAIYLKEYMCFCENEDQRSIFLFIFFIYKKKFKI